MLLVALLAGAVLISLALRPWREMLAPAPVVAG